MAVNYDLIGPYAQEAARIVEFSLRLSPEKAQAVSDAWELDSDPDYLSYCSMVLKALEGTGRTVPFGWLETVFADCAWVKTTKALHAVADAVMATLVTDIVATPVVRALIAPWWMTTQETSLADGYVINEESICLTV